MRKTITYNKTTPERIDKFIHSAHSDFSRRFFQLAIKNGQISVNNKKVSSSYKLKNQDKIKIQIKEAPEDKFSIEEQDISFGLISEHPDFLIINKPAGISVHPCQNERSGTLVNGLMKEFPEIKSVGENEWRPGIVHRLDKETSGILIVAKNQKTFQYFKQIFQDRKIQKTYLAWIWGNLKNKEGEINAYIGRSNQNPTKQAVSHNSEKLINPKNALTHYKVIKESDDKSLVELKPKTGRKHQLRLHLHSLGHPILGDKKYFNKTIKKANQKYRRHLLHAQRIEFEFSDGKKYQFEANLPKDMKIDTNK